MVRKRFSWRKDKLTELLGVKDELLIYCTTWKYNAIKFHNLAVTLMF